MDCARRRYAPLLLPSSRDARSGAPIRRLGIPHPVSFHPPPIGVTSYTSFFIEYTITKTCIICFQFFLSRASGKVEKTCTIFHEEDNTVNLSLSNERNASSADQVQLKLWCEACRLNCVSLSHCLEDDARMVKGIHRMSWNIHDEASQCYPDASWFSPALLISNNIFHSTQHFHGSFFFIS